MTAQIAQIAQAQRDGLERLYTFRLGNDLFGDPITHDDLSAFLDEHPSIMPVLRDAPAQLVRFFPNRPLYLTLNFDPENPAFDHIGVYVTTLLPIVDALMVEKDFSRTWRHEARRTTQWRVSFSACTPKEMGEE